MMSELSLFGVAFGVFGLGSAFLFWCRLTAEQRVRERIEEKANLLSECVQARVGGIGAESCTALEKYFSALKFQIAEQIKQLEQAQNNSVTPYVVAASETDHTRLVDRKERFVGYRDALLNANVQIEVVVRYLKDDRALIESLLDRLNSGRLHSAMGNLEIEAIERAISQLRREAVDDLIGELRVGRRKAEFDHIVKFREAMVAAEKRLRDAEPENPMAAKAARRLGDA